MAQQQQKRQGTMNAIPQFKADEFLDVIIIGAGISGINATYHIQTNFPDYKYALLEGRSRIGGTWDLFRYPGIRSDTDLPTFGFSWNPWLESRCVADGASIADYLRQSAEMAGIDAHIRFNHQVAAANWSSKSQTWQLVVDVPGQGTRFLETRFLVLGTGYYDYKEPLKPLIPGLEENFKGTIVHPQFWPEDLDYAGKNILVIGSGATAITLLPSLADKANKVTMLQRSPGYIMTIPNTLGTAWYHKVLPRSWGYKIERLLLMLAINVQYYYCRMFPAHSRAFLQGEVAKQIPSNIPMDPHFTPTYEPWDQRVCFTPDGDFFQALRSGRGAIETGHIRTATANSIVLESGEELQADIVVTATGLNLRLCGHILFSIDSENINLADRFAWRTTLLQDVPNLAFMIGFINASWTLGTEASSLLLCRILRRMSKGGYKQVVPRLPPKAFSKFHSIWPVNATYVEKAQDQIPKCADVGPWKGRLVYTVDRWRALYGSITQDLVFTKG